MNLNIDKVNIVVGGHCTPESAAIAPIANKNKIIMLASITTSPVLSNSGPYVFRTSPVSVIQSKLLSDLALQKLNIKKVAIIYELTDYAKPIAQSFKDNFSTNGGIILIFEGYTPGTNDFRTILQKTNGSEGIFIVPQSPDAGLILLKQIKELGIKAKLFGNDVAVNQNAIDNNPSYYEGLFIAMPIFGGKNDLKTKEFIDAYNERWNTKDIPYGIWTAESYDGVFIIAEGLKKYGDNVEKLKKYLESISDYHGASGSISIDENHDGVREYSLRTIKNGKIEEYKP